MAMYEDYREQKIHGKKSFPFDIYACSIPEDIPEVLTHWHDEMELILIRKGRGCIYVDGEMKEVTGPALVIVFPGQLHSIRRCGEEPLEYRNIIFHPELMYSMVDGMTDRDYLRPFFDRRFMVPSFVDSTCEELPSLIGPLEACGEKGEDHGDGYALLAKGQLYLLVHRLLQLFPERAAAGGRRKANDRIKPVLTYLMNNYAEKLTIADAASVAGFSEAHFMRYFHENMGVSFVTYLKDYRLAQAEEKIRTTDRSILSIAQDSGFSNLSYFIRSFKERYRMSPLQYRKERGRQ